MTRPVLRVLHVITGLYRGGAEAMLYKLIQALPEAEGFRHSVIGLLDGGEIDFSALGASVCTLGLRRGVPAPQALCRLRLAMASANPDVVHGWMYHGNIAASLAAPRKLPVIWGIHHALHNYSEEKALTRLLIYSGPRLSGRVKRILYCSQASQLQHEALGYPASRSQFIANGFDCDVFRPDPYAAAELRRELALQDDAVLIGNAARFDPIKNHQDLIRAFARLVDLHPKAHLLLAGAGVSEENEELSGLIRHEGAAGRVVMLGQRNDMPRFYAGLDAFALSSRSECFPNVLGEAMACGIPCVSTDVGDAASIIGSTGQLAPAGDVAALTAAMNALLGLSPSDRRSLGEAARMRILAKFSLASVARRYAEVYRHVAQEE